MARRKWRSVRVPAFAAVGACALVGLASGAVAGFGSGGSKSIDPSSRLARLAPPDLVLYNGKVSTVDAHDSVVEAVAIRDGEILATGNDGPVRALAKRDTTVINLHGRRVLPGIIDAHLHGLRNGYHCFSQSVRNDNVLSRAQALAAYAAKASELADGRWIFTTSGWNVRQLDQPGMFTLAELDAAAPENPVWVGGSGFNGVQVNSAALEAAGLSAGMPGVAVDANGNPTGQLTGAARSAAGAKVIEQMNQHSIDDQAECLADFIETANSVGLTAWQDPEGNTNPFNPEGGCQEFATDLHGHQPVLQLWRDERLNARIAFHLMNNFSGLPQVLADTRHVLAFLGDDTLRYLGVGEEVLCPGNQPPPPGNAREYQDLVDHLAANRISFENHASRGETQEAYLDAWENANDVYPLSTLHWSMAHPGEDGVSPTSETLARVKALDVGMTPSDSGVLGRATAPPYKRMYDSGIRMCIVTDAMNVSSFLPFVNLWYVTSGKTFDATVPGVAPEQRLSRTEALRSATTNCAWNLDQEGRLGSIEPGNHADLIVLTDDYFTVPMDEIRNIRSVLTLVGGRITWASGPYAGLHQG